MQQMLRHAVALMVAVALLVGAVHVGLAQEEDDEEFWIPGAVPLPEECISEPRSQAEIDAALQAGEAMAALPSGLPVPLGTPVGLDTRNEVYATIREMIACLNAGEPLRGAALFTDNGLIGYLGPVQGTTGDEVEAATPTPRTEDQWLRLRAVTDTSTLEDGRVAAFVVLNDPLVRGRGAQTLLFVLAQDGDRWLIDGTVGFSVIAPTGTPVP